MAESRGWAEVSMAAVATVSVLLLAWLIRTKASHKSQRRLPPGPRGWPIIGAIPYLGLMPHESFYKLSKKFGPIMYMHLGSIKALVVTSPKYAQEIMKTQDRVMSSRPSIIAAKIFLYDCDIIFSPSGKHWRYLKKVVSLNVLTPARISQYQVRREREILNVIHFILEESQRGRGVNMTECFSQITINNMTQMMMNKSYTVLRSSGSESARSESSNPIMENLREAVLLLGVFNLADLFPVLERFDPQGVARRMTALHKKIDRFVEDIIEEHRQKLSTAKTESDQEDFVDALLKIGHTKDFDEPLSNDGIKATLLEMVAGGGDTTSTTAVWALTELIAHPKAMRKAQEEINSVVGPHRLVQDDDFPQLKYLTAVIKETFRLHPAGPLLIPHHSFDDCEIDGYHIPAGTRVFINAWGIHRDPAVWERPLEFDPDRFLNSHIDYKGLDYELLPFGSGRRICPGVHLGMIMLLGSLANLIHAVDFSLPAGEKLDKQDLFGTVLYKKVPLTVQGKARLANHIIYPATKV